MTHRRIGQLVAIVASAASLLALAACGLQPATSGVEEAEPGSIPHYDSLDGVPITVGAKDFTEQIVLGNLISTVLATAGADVTNRSNTAGSATVRKAMLAGEFDIAPEYTGTGWITYLGHPKPIPDEKKQWQAVAKEDKADNDLVWLPPAPMNNTYAFAMGPDAADELGISTLSEMADLPKEDLTFCVDSEFASRDDGFVPMLEHYGLSESDVTAKTLGVGQIYQATAEGACNFGEVFTTDGRIQALDLTVLEDDKHFFPLYNMTEVVNGELLNEHPEIADIFAKINPKLTNEALQDLNGRVDVDGQDPAKVALDWLKEEGFVN